MAESCAKCTYWSTRQGPGKVGDCRRFPHFIEKKPGQWCGEFSRDKRLVRIHQPRAAGNVCPECDGEDGGHHVCCSRKENDD